MHELTSAAAGHELFCCLQGAEAQRHSAMPATALPWSCYASCARACTAHCCLPLCCPQELVAHEVVAAETNRADQKAKEAIATVSAVESAAKELGHAQTNTTATIGTLTEVGACVWQRLCLMHCLGPRGQTSASRWPLWWCRFTAWLHLACVASARRYESDAGAGVQCKGSNLTSWKREHRSWHPPSIPLRAKVMTRDTCNPCC
jgi:hypothetical protein